MAIWAKGDINVLLVEGRCLQKHLRRSVLRSKGNQNLARSFANLMFKGKTSAAMDLLSKRGSSSVLHARDPVNKDDGSSPTVLGVLRSKHPCAQAATDEILLHPGEEPPSVHPVIFDSIDASAIRSAALATKGASGPSGLDAHCWRRLGTLFHSASQDLCHSLALFAKRLATTFVDPKGLKSYLACRLIALDKCPGVRPIGICETVRRIIAKAILSVTRADIQDAAGSRQLCAGQISGIEAAVHAVRGDFKLSSTEATLLVDASNAFNSLNREVALHNIQFICPSLATAIINTYRESTDLFVDDTALLSQEGTTQGDPFAMPFYALATIPLIRRLDLAEDLKQVWYADDASVSGGLPSIRSWWDEICRVGPAFSYNPNASKTWLVTKSEHRDLASTIFSNTDVNITAYGRPYLGAPQGSDDFSREFVLEKINEWKYEIEQLSFIAKSQPQAAYSAFTHGFVHKFAYLCRTTWEAADLLQPLEDCINSTFIPSLTGRDPPNSNIRSLLALPARLGGLGISDMTKSGSAEYQASVTITNPLSTLISEQSDEYSYDCVAAQVSAKNAVKKQKRESTEVAAESVRSSLPESLKRAMDLAQEKGASHWLTTLPLSEYGFSLHKGAFRDANALRYGWSPLNTPSHCACGSSFSVQHALSCPKGGFPTLRHNEVRDLTAKLMTEVCHDVCVEPHLQPLSGESLNANSAISTDGARLDVAANGFWGGRHERAFFDIRVFNPHAPSNGGSIAKCYRKHENIKKRAYDQRVREIEQGTFTPLVLSSTGGMGAAATVFYKRLASMMAAKRDQAYSKTLTWVRCTLSFALLRSSIQCIRGARSSIGWAARENFPPIDLVTSEASISSH